MTKIGRPRRVDADVVDVEPPGHPSLARHELACRAGFCRLAGGQPVDEAPQHRLAADPQLAAVGPQALAMLDQPLMAADRAVGLAADEDQPACLVGGQRQARIDARQPFRKPRRVHQDRALCGRLGGCFGCHAKLSFHSLYPTGIRQLLVGMTSGRAYLISPANAVRKIFRNTGARVAPLSAAATIEMRVAVPHNCRGGTFAHLPC